MWNSLIKLSVLSLIWKRHRKTLITFALLLISFWVLNLIHKDYLAYADIQDHTQWVGLSFIVKWLFFLIAGAVFVLTNLKSKPGSTTAHHTKQQAPIREEAIDTLKASQETTSTALDERFVALREKKTLSSKADLLLKNKNSR